MEKMFLNILIHYFSKMTLEHFDSYYLNAFHKVYKK